MNAGRTDCPITDRCGERAALKNVKECAGRNEAALRMVPSPESFGADYAAVLQMESILESPIGDRETPRL